MLGRITDQYSKALGAQFSPEAALHLHSLPEANDMRAYQVTHFQLQPCATASLVLLLTRNCSQIILDRMHIHSP